MVRSEKTKGIRRSRDEWRALLRRFGASELGVEAFCRRESISAASFYRWRSTLSSERVGGAVVVQGDAPAFVDLGAVNSRSPRQRLDLKLDLGDGVVLHLVRS